jgi:hypothetical protein
MYHMVTIGDIAISMVWLGILVFIAVVTSVIWQRSSKFVALNFDKFFAHLPLIVLSCYLIWSWSWYAINQLVLLPTSLEQILLYASPSWRNFSLLWVLIWWVIGFWSFLTKQPKHHRALRVDIFFEAICIGMIPLWIFLVLGDSFIWVPTQGALWVSAIQANSKLALYNSVLPIWFGISLIGMVWYWILAIRRNKRTPWYGYLWFSALSILVAFLTLYQNYARRIIVLIGDTRLDVKQYVLAIIAVYFIVIWYRSRNNTNQE